MAIGGEMVKQRRPEEREKTSNECSPFPCLSFSHSTIGDRVLSVRDLCGLPGAPAGEFVRGYAVEACRNEDKRVSRVFFFSFFFEWLNFLPFRLSVPPSSSFFSLLLSLPKLQTLADASNYAGPLCQALRRGASLDEEERKHARKGILRASAAGSSSDCLQLLPAIGEKEQQQASNNTEEPAAENDDSAESEEEEDSLRDRLVARQLEVVDALCRALREALEGMERATAAAARLADDGAALARDAVAAPSSSSSASAAASAAALSSGGASPCAASTASSLADAARAMAATSACARAAAGAVESGANVGGLRALLRTLRGERRRREEFFPLHFSGFFLQFFSFLLTKADKRHHQPPQKTHAPDSPCLDEDHFADAVDVVLATEPRAC